MDKKIALVTGGSTGIGAAVVRLLAEHGSRVAICDVNEDAGRTLAEEVDGLFITCDVRSADSVAEAVKICAEQFGVPDYVHLNAGVMTVPTDEPFLAIEDVSQAQFEQITGVNFNGVYYGLKSLLPVMRAKGGAITITASTAGLTVVPIDPLYTATKYALVGLARAVAAANDGSNMRINVICPGVVDTQIVPDAFRAPEFGMMPTQVMAKEVVELLHNGANGEVRVKTDAQLESYVMDIPSLQR